MSLHCGFVFPEKQFKLIFMDTVGYISDNVFYRMNMISGQTEIVHHAKGRSYQAIAVNHKRGLVVLAEYCQNPSLYFEFLHHKQQSFSLQNVCKLEIKRIQISLDLKYLLVASGIPNDSILIIDIQKKCLMPGQHNSVPLKRKGEYPIKIEFNPNNSKIFAVMYRTEVYLYEIFQGFQIGNSEIQESINIITKTIYYSQDPLCFYQTFVWDEINNLYTSNGQTITIISSDTNNEIVHYDIELEESGSGQQMVVSMLLSPKHLIIFYRNGKVQWVNKYYPDLMEEEQFAKRPLFLDKIYEIKRNIRYAIFDHYLSKIFVSTEDGYFFILPKAAEAKQQEDEEEKQQKIQSDKKVGEKKLDLQLRTIGPFHCSKIIFVREIANTTLSITISKDGVIIFWSLTQKKALSTFNIGLELKTADINRYQNVLAVGTSNGCIQFYSIAKMQNVYLFKQFKLSHQSTLDEVLFSTNSQEIAVMIKEQKRIFYILTNLSFDFQVLGYVNIPHNLHNICWNNNAKTSNKAKFQYLLVSIGYGVLMINGPTAISSKKRGKSLELVQCQIYGLRTDLEQNRVFVLPSGEIVTTGQDKLYKKYKQPEELLSKIDFKSRVAIPPPIQQIDAHDLPVLSISSNKKYLVSGSVDGGLQIRQYDSFHNFQQIRAFGWKQQNLSVVGVSNFDGVLYCCGNDGSFYVWKTNDKQSISGSDKFERQKVKGDKIEGKKKQLKYYEIIMQEEYLEKMKDAINKKKKNKFQKVDKIKKELQALLAENEKHDQLQKLSRDQFAIDLQSRQKVAQAGRQQCLRIREESKRFILEKEVFTKKLKQITWNRMQVHLKAINGLKSNFIVYNYQIRKRMQEQLRTVNIILELRRNQKKQLQKRLGNQIVDPQFHKNKNVVNGGMMPTLILSNYQKKDEKKDDKGKKKKEQEVQQKEVVEQLETDQEWALLYSSFELFSENAKRNQIIMMKNIIIKIKEVFNVQFNKLLQFRQNQNQIINDKNKRIIEICEQLKKPNQVIISNKNILENPDRILQIKPQDITFKRYLSKEEREKLEKERLKQQERLRLLAQDDASQRALQKMMGGTLEQKKTSVLEVTIERQKWMDKALDDMSEEQKLKLKEFQVRKMKAQQERQRIIKKLEAELRKLKQQIQDIMEKYDERLFVLLKRRIQYDYRIQQQELYCAKLAFSIVSCKDQAIKSKICQEKTKKYQKKLQILSQNLQAITQFQQEFTKEKNNKKIAQQTRKLGQIQSKIRTIQKTVFQDYGTNKKRREMEQKLLQRDPNAKYQLIPLDPMRQIQFRNLSALKSKDYSFFAPEIKSLQQTYDITENSVGNLLEGRFNFRKQDSQLERKLKNLRDSTFNIQKEIQLQKDSQQKCKQQIEQIQAFLIQSKSDLQIQCRIKQGQVEISGDSPIPNLDDALLIAKSQIDIKNELIKSNADEKIQVMSKIKTCKISVTEETLNLQKKQQLINQLSVRIKQIQMLKVKKQMQMAINKKDSKINEVELKSLKSRIQDLKRQGQKRITLFEKKIQQINREIQTLMKENKTLQVQKYNLQTTVKQREKIKDMMCGQNGEGNQESAEKFQQIAINRKLFDKAKQQTQEIQLLREELSKLKAKTFANFSNVQR